MKYLKYSKKPENVLQWKYKKEGKLDEFVEEKVFALSVSRRGRWLGKQ